MRKFGQPIFVLVIILISLCACNSSVSQESLQTDEVNLQKTVLITQTPVDLPTPTIQVEETEEALPTATAVVPTETATPTIAPTVTPTAAPIFTSKPMADIALSQAIYLYVHDLESVWRYESGQSQLERVSSEDLQVSAFDVWPDDGRRAYGTSDGQIFVELPGQELQLLYEASEWELYEPFVRSIAWSPDGAQLAYTMGVAVNSDSTHAVSTDQFDGLSLLSLAGEHAVLVNNEYCYYDLLNSVENLINECYALVDAVWSPDGTALLLTASHWEWDEFLVLDPIAVDTVPVRPYDFYDWWLHASWTQDSEAVLFSGGQYGPRMALMRVPRDSSGKNLLPDETVVLQMSFDLPSGLAFMALDEVATGYQAYFHVGWQPGEAIDVTNGIPIPDEVYPRDVVWNATGETAVLIHREGDQNQFVSAQLMTLDGTFYDLGAVLSELGEVTELQAVWGP